MSQEFRRYIRRFGPVERGILVALEDLGQASLEEIAVRVWDEGQEHRPENWEACLRNAIHRLRRKQILVENESIYFLG